MTSYQPITPYPGESWDHAAVRFVADLARCEHGRSSIDSCNSCPDGHSAGNPRARGEDPRLADGSPILGYNISGHAYVLVTPQPSQRHPDTYTLVEVVRT
jgi:hypothetical protein